MSRRCTREGFEWPRVEQDRARTLISFRLTPWDGLFLRVVEYERRGPSYRQELMEESHRIVLSFLRHGVASKRRGVCSHTRGWHDPILPKNACPRRYGSVPSWAYWCERSNAPESFCLARPG